MSEKKINGRFFKAGEALATDSIRIQIRLMKLVGPALEKIPVLFAARAAGASEAQKVEANNAAIGAISTIFADASPDAVVALIEDVLKLGMISYDGKGAWDEIDLDQEFSGANQKDLIPALVFILQETLGDFFSGALASGNQAMKARA